MKTAREKHYIYLDSHHKPLDFKLKEVWKYRDLIWLFTKRSFQLSYKQTILGPFWLFIGPIASSIIYTVIFGGVAGIQTDGVPHLLYYMVSSTVWSFFASSLTGNASTFTSNAGIFGKVYFPRLVVPISNVLSSLIRFFINSIITVALLIYYIVQGDISLHYGSLWMLPLALIVLGFMGMGCGIIVSSLTTKYRDLSMLVGVGVSLWMYATPVVYPISQVSIPWLQTLLIFNPVTMPLEVFKYVLFGRAYFIPISLAVSVFFTIAVMFIGIILFNKVERNFMDTV